MKNNFISKSLRVLTILVTLYSCRNNDLNEQNISHNPNASKFSFVTLKDIPEVANYIHQKTGREDFYIPLHNQNTAKTFDFSSVNPSTIVKKTDGDFIYYIFGIDSPINEEGTIYNLEIKEIRGKMESMNIIVYQSSKPLSSDPKTRFDYFTGKVSSMDIEGKVGSTVGYNDGVGDCPPPTGDGGGNPDLGTGTIGTGDIPPNGGWYDGGGGHNGEEPWTTDPTGCWDIITDPIKPWITLGWSNHCTGQQISNVNKIAGGGYAKLTADCNGDGSGVIITNPIENPCEKIITENNKAKIYLGRPLAAARKVEITNGISTADQEKGFSFGYDNTGAEKVTLVKVGVNGGSVNIVALGNTFTITGGVHTHMNDGFYVSSVGDLYTFSQANELNPKFQYYYTLAPNGDEYVFTITDQTAFNDFFDNFPGDQYVDDNADWITTTNIGIDATKVYQYFLTKGKSDDESKELSQAFVIGKYGMGIGLSKKDTSGNFQPIFVKELPDPNDPTKKIYEKTTDCNL